MNTFTNLAAYQEWKATYWANDPNGKPTAEMLRALFFMEEKVAFISQHKQLAGSHKRELMLFATLGYKPASALSHADCAAFDQAYESLRIAFDESVKADIGGVVEYVDGLIRNAQKDKAER